MLSTSTTCRPPVKSREAGLTVLGAANSIGVADGEGTVHPGAVMLVACSRATGLWCLGKPK